MKDRLEQHYMKTRRCSESAFRKFVSRCRLLKRLRDNGLQYAIFCPTLLTLLDRLDVNRFEAWTAARKELFRYVDASVARHCPDWLQKLEALCPSQKLGACLAQPVNVPLRQLLRGSGDERRYNKHDFFFFFGFFLPSIQAGWPYGCLQCGNSSTRAIV